MGGATWVSTRVLLDSSHWAWYILEHFWSQFQLHIFKKLNFSPCFQYIYVVLQYSNLGFFNFPYIHDYFSKFHLKLCVFLLSFVFSDLAHQGFYLPVFSDPEPVDLFVNSRNWLPPLLPLDWPDFSQDSRQTVQQSPGARTGASLGSGSQRVQPGQAPWDVSEVAGHVTTMTAVSRMTDPPKLSWGHGIPEVSLSHIIYSVSLHHFILSGPNLPFTQCSLDLTFCSRLLF